MYICVYAIYVYIFLYIIYMCIYAYMFLYIISITHVYIFMYIIHIGCVFDEADEENMHLPNGLTQVTGRDILYI